jgi:hypothetical protein
MSTRPRVLLTIGEQLQRDRCRQERRTFAHQLGKLIGAAMLLAVLWLE